MPVVEDFFNVRSYEPFLYQCTAGNAVEDAVFAEGPFVSLNETMGVVPLPIWTFDLVVYEAVRWVPFQYLGSPSDGYAM